MGDLVSLPDAKPINEGVLGLKARVVMMLARGRGQPSKPVKVVQHAVARLLPNDGIQPACQMFDFFREDYSQSAQR